MSKVDWIVFIVAWSSVPLVLILKAWLDYRQAKVWRETQGVIDAEMARIRRPE